MLGNLNSNQNSPNKIENSILVQSLTENEEKEIPINDTPKKMKKRISPKKQATPTAGKYSRGTSSKRLRTIESFLIAPKAKRVKSTDLEDSPKKSQTIKSKGNYYLINILKNCFFFFFFNEIFIFLYHV